MRFHEEGAGFAWFKSPHFLPAPNRKRVCAFMPKKHRKNGSPGEKNAVRTAQNVSSSARSAELNSSEPNRGASNPLLAAQGAPASALFGTADYYFQLGEANRQAGQLEEATNAYLQALQVNPSHHQTLGAMGQALTRLTRYQDALEFFSLALNASPTPLDSLEHLYHLGQLYQKIRHFEPAVECYDYVLKMQSDHRLALIALSQVYRQLGQTENAIGIYDRMLALQPDDPSLLLSKALSLPVMYDSNDSLNQWRAGVERQIDAILSRNFPENRALALHGSSFYLAYQGFNDRELMQKIARVFQKFLPPAPAISKRKHGKPRIGIVSRFLAPSHTVGRFMQGIIQHLSREKFQVITFSVGRDTAYLPIGGEHPEDGFVILPENNIESAARQIAEHQPDILFYADLGMNVTTYCLAGMRLAPVQCVAWGHPVTSGLSTVDYFISSRLIEPENAQAHYSENLVLLENLPTYYYRPEVSEKHGERAQFGFSEQANLYVCPQSLFKFHPDFDAILAGILRQDPQGEAVLLSHYSEAVNRQLLARFEHAMPDVAQRIRILPRLDRAQFLQLLTCADVLLDPVHFGGGNTTYEALALGVPIVTWPSAFMRGRATAACYQKMNLSGLVANGPEDYVRLAISVAQDKDLQAKFRAEILEKNATLFEDESVIGELETFFQDALSRHQGAIAHD